MALSRSYKVEIYFQPRSGSGRPFLSTGAWAPDPEAALECVMKAHALTFEGGSIESTKVTDVTIPGGEDPRRFVDVSRKNSGW